MDDEQRLLNRVQFLAHHLFITTAEGREFVKLMKLLHVYTPTFPQQAHVIEAHGGALGWATFREGQLTLIRSLELLAKNYLQKLEAENQVNKEINK
jgi:hypothetical protein